jgi:hypothetical protein
MNPTLQELLTESEKEQIKLDVDYYDLTIGQLKEIALPIIKTKYKGNIPNCNILAETIEILTDRRIKLNK